MATQENTSKDLKEISYSIEVLAAQLAGIKSIAELTTAADVGHDAGNVINSIGALADYINEELCKIATRVTIMADKGGVA